jgi:cell division protein FtsI/penicillin-binding protein 2
MAGITRNGNSFIVRIYRNGKEHSTSFAFSKYGGEESALQAAEKFQEDAERKIQPTQKKLLKNNTTGKNGVSRGYESVLFGRRPAYIATVTRKGKKIHKTFPYQDGNKEEEKKAFEDACKARDEMEEEE